MIKLLLRTITLTAVGAGVRVKYGKNHLNTKNSIKDSISIATQGLKIEVGSKEMWVT